MSTKLVQKHLVKGTRAFEIVDDTIEYRITTLTGEEELAVVLSVLDPQPVVSGSLLSFVSRVNGEALVEMFVDKPDAETFNAFIDTLQQRIKEEDFGSFRVGEGGAVVDIDQLDTDINMLQTYLDPGEIADFLAALNDLKAQPDDAARLAHVADAFNNLGPYQGPVLAYASYLKTLFNRPVGDVFD